MRKPDGYCARMDQEVTQARERLEDEFRSVKESLGDMYVALEALRAAGPEDDLVDLLGAVEDAAKKARTGGVIGSGAKSHAKALKAYRELTDTQTP